MIAPFVNSDTVRGRFLLSSPLQPTRQSMIDENQQELRRQLEALRSEHRDLDDTIAREGAQIDQLQLQRLKKRKLMLKDQIAKLESSIHPDIIA